MAQATDRPNILWITSEDNGPELGCYGDSLAVSPNIDRLARDGLRYLHCWSNAPVCAPARTTIITGMYASSFGASFMRCRAQRIPETMLLPELLRDAGYYCTNNVKEDYNFAYAQSPWNQSSRTAHWRNRSANTPFFSVFNLTTTHESQIRIRPHQLRTDPSRIQVPPYHPDLPEVRRDWAQYYDKIEEMDQQVGEILAQLDSDGLRESTIIFYYGDHGSGMPRSKRWLYQSGLHVPMIVSIPAKWRHLAGPEYVPGGTSERLISFVDLAPTVLRLAGAPLPNYLQGQPFLGHDLGESPKYVFGFRDRMDERIDMSRSIRSHRFLYIRNFMPYRPQGAFLSYMFETPTSQVWKDAFDQGQLNSMQSSFWKTKPVEELYDLENDPYQIHNLADQPPFQETKDTMAAALKQWMIDHRDHGVIPESIIQSGDHLRGNLREMIDAAWASDEVEDWPALIHSSNPVARYWGMQKRLAFAVRDPRQGPSLAEKSRPLLEDTAPEVRIVAAELMARFDEGIHRGEATEALMKLSDLRQHGLLVALAALNALANFESPWPEVRTLPNEDTSLDKVYDDYIKRLQDYLGTAK